MSINNAHVEKLMEALHDDSISLVCDRLRIRARIAEHVTSLSYKASKALLAYIVGAATSSVDVAQQVLLLECLSAVDCPAKLEVEAAYAGTLLMGDMMVLQPESSAVLRLFLNSFTPAAAKAVTQYGEIFTVLLSALNNHCKCLPDSDCGKVSPATFVIRTVLSPDFFAALTAVQQSTVFEHLCNCTVDTYGSELAEQVCAAVEVLAIPASLWIAFI